MSSLLPASYNRVDPLDGSKVWTQCQCGWRTRKRTAGRTPGAVMPHAFHCPRCGTKLSESTVVVAGSRAHKSLSGLIGG